MSLFTAGQLEDARRVVAEHLRPTPQYPWPLLAGRCGTEVWVKHENHTPTGAFKVRGGLVYMQALAAAGGGQRGVISATRGNHGQSLAFAGRTFGIPVTIVVPHGNSREKNAAMRAFGAELVETGRDFDEAREAAERIAAERKLRFAPSFAPELVCGVATYAAELFAAVPDLDAVYAPIGLGSGICGILGVRDLLGLRTDVIGVVARNADTYARSFRAGRPVPGESADTVADGMAVRVPDPEAFAEMRRGLADLVEVEEEEIIAAMRHYWTDTHNLAEGAGAAPLAALLRQRDRMRGRRVALVLSGGNVDLELFLRLMAPREHPGLAADPAAPHLAS